MKITVNCCKNCPFFNDRCNLLQYSPDINSDIVHYDVQAWCPLLNEDCYLCFKKFTNSRLEEIIELKIKIKNETDLLKINEYNNNLCELYKNEEHQIEDFNKSIDNINDQLETLKNVSDQLNNLVNNLKNEDKF